MAKMLDWRDHALTKAISSDSSLVPKLYVSQVPPAASELAAVATRETADGWPAAVVTRNSARRVAQFPLFVSETGVTIGEYPCYDIAPKLEEALELITYPKGPYFKFAHDTDNDARKKAIWLQRFEGPSLFASTMLSMLGLDLPIAQVLLDDTTANPVLPNGGGRDVARDVLDAHCTASEDDVHLFLGLSFSLGYFDGVPHFRTMVLKLLKNGRYAGIRGLLLGPMYSTADWGNNMDDNVAGWLIHRVWADKGFTRYVSLRRPGLSVETRAVGSYVEWANFWTSTTWTRLFVTECGVNPTEPIGWWNETQSVFEKRVGLWSSAVYSIGNPEFVNSFTILGQWDATARKYSAARLVFDWKGARLAEMNPEMAPADAEAVRRLSVTTVVYDTAPSKRMSLGDLKMAQMYRDNGEEIETKIYMPARPADDLPAVTFAQAAERVADLDTRIWHRQTLSEVNASQIDYVRIAGPQGAIVVQSQSGNTTVSTDPNFGLMAYLNGAILMTYAYVPGLINDPLMAAWGVSQYEIDRSGDAIQVRREFDEATVYGDGAPFLEKLSASERAAMLLSQAAMNRRMLSSFVVGSATMAANARRILT